MMSREAFVSYVMMSEGLMRPLLRGLCYLFHDI